jgi:hypothetical protein
VVRKKTMTKKNETQIADGTSPIELPTTAGSIQNSSTTPATESSIRPIPLRQDVYELLAEICAAVSFSRLHFDWITCFDIECATDEWGVTYEKKPIKHPIINFVMGLFVANQPMIIADTLIEPRHGGQFTFYRFIPTVVKDLDVKWEDAIHVVPGSKVGDKKKDVCVG